MTEFPPGGGRSPKKVRRSSRRIGFQNAGEGHVLPRRPVGHVARPVIIAGSDVGRLGGRRRSATRRATASAGGGDPAANARRHGANLGNFGDGHDGSPFSRGKDTAVMAVATRRTWRNIHARAELARLIRTSAI